MGWHSYLYFDRTSLKKLPDFHIFHIWVSFTMFRSCFDKCRSKL